MAKVDLARMERALKAAGWQVYLRNGRISAWRDDPETGATDRVELRKGVEQATFTTDVRGRDLAAVAGMVRKAYAQQTVKDLAPKYGWKLGTTTTNVLTLKR